MTNVNPAPTPIALGLKLSNDDQISRVDATLFKRLVGNLMYLTVTRPDIMYGVSLISRFMDKPKESHWKDGKRILRYIAGTKSFEILYTSSDDYKLIGYTDSDWGGRIDDRKSTSGYIFHLGFGAISWASKKQPIVTLSSAEAEYVAATLAACQAVWMRIVLSDLGHQQEEPMKIYCDNSAIALSKNHVFHNRSKNIDIQYYFIRELVNNVDICLEF
ncbi:secreted RxLR effector protein 161-like [Cryptomeria japonica]|uniref:secreted RxLR effector protein 161-like n=1 Tax=Cryptomeria japonica TaxID=3369 RepID=UPI0027DA63B0|nr:secreted RxLR effector protein 161-like [Cryptomeria japonica]